MNTHKRLNQVFKKAQQIPFDDSSKFIFFSDCHRGDNSWADNFAHNQNLFYHALNHYYKNDFTYIEVGDGDELWENKKFSKIIQTYGHIFKLFRKFYLKKRLYLIYGNHDMERKNPRQVEKTLYQYHDETHDQPKPLFENIKMNEGIVLKHKKSGKKIFLTHGHQGDLINDKLWFIDRILVRYLWRYLQILGIRNPRSPADNSKKKAEIERKLVAWTKKNKQILIAGHTHRPRLPNKGTPPYFNCGSCIHPRCITGLEIQNGQITLIKWHVRPKNDGALYIVRKILEGPAKLASFF